MEKFGRPPLVPAPAGGEIESGSRIVSLRPAGGLGGAPRLAATGGADAVLGVSDLADLLC